MNKGAVAITFAIFWVVLLVSAAAARYIGEAYAAIWLGVWLLMLMAESGRRESAVVRLLVSGLVAAVWPGWAVVLAASPLLPAGSPLADPRARKGARAARVENPQEREHADQP